MSPILASAIAGAVRRAELRRRGVLPLMRRDRGRELLEDRLLELAQAVRQERAAARDLYPTATRNVVALPVNKTAPVPLGPAGRLSPRRCALHEPH